MERPKFVTEHTYKQITFEEMTEYLATYGTPEERAEFKKKCTIKADGSVAERVNWQNGKKWFVSKFIPELTPSTKKKKSSKFDILKDW